jgi:hypothetical protein
MASLDSLPADQRAVLQLVLQRGHSYDDIARMLSIDRAAVRERALGALDALGPQSRVPPERRALITDYLLGQLPPKVAEETRNRLAESASERAWARVVASELAPLSSAPLPEIPVEAPSRRPAPAAGAVAAAAGAEQDTAPKIPADYGAPPPQPPGSRPSSRRGGAILLGLLVLVAAIVVVIVIVIATSGGSSHKNNASATPPATTSTSTSTTSTNKAKIVAQVNLASPLGSKTIGVAYVLKQGSQAGIVIRAQGVPANTKHDAYAVWLANSGSDAVRLGFVNPGVGGNGRLQTAGGLPANANHFSQVLITLEHAGHPTHPGTIVLQGHLTPF